MTKEIKCYLCGKQCRTMNTSDSGEVFLCLNAECKNCGEPHALEVQTAVVYWRYEK